MRGSENSAADTGGSEPTTISLADGRDLCVREFGDEAGRPVVFIHGGGMGATGLFAQPCDDAARQRGLRILAPDRPGVGESSPLEGRLVLDWPRDVTEMADEFGLDRFDILSHSGGAAYALACAYALPERVSSVTLVSAVASKWLITSGEHVPRKVKLNARLNAGAPDGVLISAFSRWKREMEKNPQKAFRSFLQRLPRCERRSLNRPEVAAALESCGNAALRQGPMGVAADLRLIFEDGRFEIEDIEVPVFIWHGECDSTSSVAVARMLAERIPGAQLHVLPDEGHLSMWLNRNEEILGGLGG